MNENENGMPVDNDLPPVVVETDDAFNVAVDGVDTSMPILREKLYTVLIAKAEKTPSKATPGNFNLRLTLKTKEEALTVTGEIIPEGWPLFQNIPITPNPEYTPQMISKKIAGVCKSIGLLGVTVKQIMDAPTLLEGGVGTVKVKVAKETAEFPASNQVASWLEVK